MRNRESRIALASPQVPWPSTHLYLDKSLFVSVIRHTMRQCEAQAPASPSNRGQKTKAASVEAAFAFLRTRALLALIPVCGDAGMFMRSLRGCGRCGPPPRQEKSTLRSSSGQSAIVHGNQEAFATAPFGYITSTECSQTCGTAIPLQSHSLWVSSDTKDVSRPRESNGKSNHRCCGRRARIISRTPPAVSRSQY